MARILVIDDDQRIVNFVARVLTAEGWGVDTSADSQTGLRMAMTGVYDLVVLDLLMPGIDGASLLAQLMEERPDQAVLVLSAVADVEVRVRCLRLGAADFLVKPFAISELVARVAARLRWPVTNGHGYHIGRAGRVALNGRLRTADAGSGPVHLSEKEFLLLQHLVRNAPEVCAREELLADVWGLSFSPGSNLVDVCVARLRQKLGSDLVETIRHVGYRVACA